MSDTPPSLLRWFSVGDIISIVAMLIMVGSVYSAIRMRLDQTDQRIADIRKDLASVSDARVTRIEEKLVYQSETLRRIESTVNKLADQ